ncbi:hypothetical protein SAMN05660830_01500 [Halodesulfovibrio aestuarii]|uniref:Uncharacterized protein n=1 Tax=Halodesulfovibrio aestuarii TaxID=126333 RepID=A0A8G2C987_9BACT|nr:hypothetical protein SAMN05660830_01500 [Halodesulfovibrio aestuarii]
MLVVKKEVELIYVRYHKQGYDNKCNRPNNPIFQHIPFMS